MLGKNTDLAFEPRRKVHECRKDQLATSRVGTVSLTRNIARAVLGARDLEVENLARLESPDDP